MSSGLYPWKPTFAKTRGKVASEFAENACGLRMGIRFVLPGEEEEEEYVGEIPPLIITVIIIYLF